MIDIYSGGNLLIISTFLIGNNESKKSMFFKIMILILCLNIYNNLSESVTTKS